MNFDPDQERRLAEYRQLDDRERYFRAQAKLAKERHGIIPKSITAQLAKVYEQQAKNAMREMVR